MSTNPGAAPPNAIEYESVSYSYARRGGNGAGGGARAADARGDDRLALDHITLAVREGERLGILGPNGGGKTTLLKLTLGLLRGFSGRIRVCGRTPEEARKLGLIGYVPQRVESELAFPISVRQVVAMAVTRGLLPWRSAGTDGRERVENALRMVGAEAIADRPIGQLSGGQVQRVMIARALAGRPRVLLLDEPTVGIDVAGQQRFGEMLKSLHDRLGLTIVLVSHDIRTIASGSDRVACLSRTLHSHVAPEGLTPEVLAEVFRHDVAAIFGDVHVHAHPAAECHDPSHEHEHGHDHGHEPAPGTRTRGTT